MFKKNSWNPHQPNTLYSPHEEDFQYGRPSGPDEINKDKEFLSPLQYGDTPHQERIV